MLRRRTILTTLLVLVLLATACVAALVATFDLNRFREQIQAGLSAALSQPVHLGAAHLSLRHGPAVDFADLKIGSGEGEAGVLRAGHLLLKLELLPLLHRELAFSEVLLEDPHLTLTLQGEKKREEGEPPLTLLLDEGMLQKTVIRSLKVRNGTLHLIDRRAPGDVYALNLEGLDAEVGDLALNRPVRLRVVGSMAQEGVLSPFALAGAITAASDRPDWRNLDVDLNLTLKNFAPSPLLRRYLATRPQLDATGETSLELVLRGTPAKALFFDGRMAGEKLQWRIPDLYREALTFKEVRCKGAWSGGDRLKLTDLALTADELSLAGMLTIEHRDGRPWIEGELTEGKLPLSLLSRLLPDAQPESASARLKTRLDGGVLEIAAARFGGPVAAFARADANFPLQQAEVTIRDAGIRLDRGGSLRGLNCSATLTRERFSLRDGKGVFLGAPVHFAATLHAPYESGRKLELQADATLPLRPLLALTPAAVTEQFPATGSLPLKLRLEGPPQRLLLDLQADLQGVAISRDEKTLKAAGTPGNLFLTAELSDERLELSHGRLQLPPLELRARGELERKGRRGFFLALDLAPLELQALLPFLPPLERLSPRGALSAHYEWKGDEGALRSRGGSVFLHNLGIHLTNNLAELNDVNGELRLLADGLEFEHLSAKLGISPLRVDGSVRDFTDPHIALHVTAQALRADELIFPSDKAVLRDVDGHLSIDRDGLSFAPVRVRLDRGTTATVTGRVENFSAPEVTLEIEAEQANIDEVIALWQRPAPKSGATPPPPSPQPQGKGKVSLRIDARVHEGILGPLNFQNARGEIGLVDGALVIFPLRFEAEAGHCTGRVEVDKKADGTSLLKMSGHLEAFDAESVQHELLKRRGLVTGTLHGDFYLEGEPGGNFLPSSLGGFNLQIKDGVLRRFKTLSRVFSILNVSQLFALRLPDMATEGMPFRRLKGNFSLSRGVLGTEDLVVDSNAMNLSLVGQTNLISGEIDAVLGLKPLRTVDKIVTQIPIAGWILAGEEKALITAHFELKGKSDDPEVTPIPITSVSEKILGIFKRVLGLPGKVVTDVGELLQGEKQ